MSRGEGRVELEADKVKSSLKVAGRDWQWGDRSTLELEGDTPSTGTSRLVLLVHSGMT